MSSRNSYQSQHRTLSASAISWMAVVLIALCPILSGCSTEGNSDPRTLTPMVSIEGSDTMEVLLKAWSADFMKQNPDIPVSVTIVDSSAGITALMDKRTDIAASSRDLTQEENKKIHGQGVHLVRRVVALDSIAVVVNRQSELEEISMDQLKDVFSGTSKQWSDLSGKSKEPIVVCIREPESGTARYFSEHVLKQGKAAKTIGAYVNTAKILPSNEALLEEIEKNKNAIGYVGLSYAAQAKDKVKLLKVKLLEDSLAIMPSLEAATNDYSLSRPLYMFFDSKTKNQTKTFVNFCLSKSGQAIVKDNGFVSLQ